MAKRIFCESSRFHFQPILHSFPAELQNLQRKKNCSSRQVSILNGKSSLFEVILSIRSEFYQIRTPHFSLEGVVRLTHRWLDSNYDD